MDFSIEQLKLIAKRLELTFSPNIGQSKLLEKLEAHAQELGTTLLDVWKDIEATQTTFSTDNATVMLNDMVEKEQDEEVERLKDLDFNKADVAQYQFDEAKQNKEATKLIRCIITSNDKNKTSLQGEIHSVRNAVISEQKKMIPFGVPTHVPQIILNVFRDKKVQMFREKKLPNGMKTKESYFINAYNINILEPITREEFEAIAQKQRAEGYGTE